MNTIELGDRVKDKITGLKGVVIGRTDWLYGCQRCCVQPEEARDGKPAETFHVDVPQLELVKKGVITRPTLASAPVERRHGPREDAARRRDAMR